MQRRYCLVFKLIIATQYTFLRFTESRWRLLKLTDHSSKSFRSTKVININSHGFTTGDQVLMDITSGTGVDGTYEVTVSDANNFTYICDMILLFFFSSHYAISVAGRLILTVCCLNMTFRRWLSGDSTLPPMLFNWFTTISLLECFSYKQNERMVQLFLEKEMVKKQEEQFKTILHNIPTNVIVVCDLKIVFKNRHSENLIKKVCDALGPET